MKDFKLVEGDLVCDPLHPEDGNFLFNRKRDSFVEHRLIKMDLNKNMTKPKPNKHEDIKELLNERNATHGSFIVNSRVSQGLKNVVRAEPGYAQLADIHREALDHMFGKIGRILAGQPTYDDHWDDIQGYAGLPKKFNHGVENSQTNSK